MDNSSHENDPDWLIHYSTTVHVPSNEVSSGVTRLFPLNLLVSFRLSDYRSLTNLIGSSTCIHFVLFHTHTQTWFQRQRPSDLSNGFSSKAMGA